MQEDKPKIPISGSDVVAAVILFVIVFFVGIVVILNVPNYFFRWLLIPVFSWLLTPVGLLIIFGFDVIWLISMKLRSLKGKNPKIFSTVLIFALSASFFACWFIIRGLRGAMH